MTGHGAYLSLAILFAGCAVDIDLPRVTPEHYDHELRVSESYPDELAEAMQAWRASFGEPIGCDPSTVYVVHEPAEPSCAIDGRDDGCVLLHTSLLFGDSVTIVVLDDARASEVVSRELRVWLKECSDA